jgi:hypothetical protein
LSDDGADRDGARQIGDEHQADRAQDRRIHVWNDSTGPGRPSVAPRATARVPSNTMTHPPTPSVDARSMAAASRLSEAP